MAKLTAPKGLGAKAKTAWDDITGTYSLRPDELRILEDACREMDLIERLEEGLVGAPLTVKGSTGQPVANPLVSEIRQHRQTVKSLLGSLKLPDDSGSGAASEAARNQANARWRRAG